MVDYIIRGIDKNQHIKIAVAQTTGVVEEARIRHGLSPTATAALGRTLTAGLLMTGYLKNKEDSMTIHIDGDGDIGKILVTGKNNGNIKGYVNNPLADAPLRADGKLDVGRVVGNNGTVTVVMDLGLKEPYVGKVPLVTGEIGEDIANYFFQSEQVPSGVGLGVLIDPAGFVRQAGGFLIQVLPGATEEELKEIEEAIQKIPSVTEFFEEGKTPEEMMNQLLPNFIIEELEKSPVAFSCECSEDKVKDSLLSLGPDQLKEILQEDGKAELTCYFCGEKYNLNSSELEKLVFEATELNRE